MRAQREIALDVLGKRREEYEAFQNEQARRRHCRIGRVRENGPLGRWRLAPDLTAPDWKRPEPEVFEDPHGQFLNGRRRW